MARFRLGIFDRLQSALPERFHTGQGVDVVSSSPRPPHVEITCYPAVISELTIDVVAQSSAVLVVQEETQLTFQIISGNWKLC